MPPGKWKIRDMDQPLRVPIVLAVGWTLSLFAVGAVSLIFGGRAVWFGITVPSGQVCVPGIDTGALLDQLSRETRGVAQASVYISQIEVCVPRPTTAQQMWAIAAVVPQFLASFGLMIGLLWMLRGIRRDPFSGVASKRSSLLGWAVLVTAPITTIFGELGRARFIATLPKSNGQVSIPGEVFREMPWGIMLVGLGLLTLARLLSMQVQDAHVEVPRSGVS